MPLADEYTALFAQLAEQPGPALSEMTPQQGREMYRMMRPANPDMPIGSSTDRSIPGPHGDIPVRIYTPSGARPGDTRPVFINFHGGGWVIGDLDTADVTCRDLANTADVVVVSVDYRMAPEHVFPAAVDDCLAATRWVADNAAAIGGNGKLAVGGESAGGNLAAVVCLQARDAGGPRIDFQLLLYPVVDHDLSRNSYAENGEGYLLTTDSMRWFWDHYCPDVNSRSNPLASPLHAPSLANLPPALVVTAEFDPLRDEGEAYAAALKAAGTAAQAVRYDGLVHDFFATAAVFTCSREPFEATCATLKAHLSPD